VRWRERESRSLWCVRVTIEYCVPEWNQCLTLHLHFLSSSLFRLLTLCPERVQRAGNYFPSFYYYYYYYYYRGERKDCKRRVKDCGRERREVYNLAPKPLSPCALLSLLPSNNNNNNNKMRRKRRRKRNLIGSILLLPACLPPAS